MTLTIPPEVPRSLVTLLAGPFPVGDEDALRRRATALRDVAKVCSELADRHAVAVSELGSVATGKAAATLAELGTTNTANLHSLAEYCASLAKQCDDAANSIEYAKKVIIVTLVMLTAQLAWDALTFFVGGAAAAPVERVAAEVEIRTAARAATTAVAERAVAGVAERSAIRTIVNTVGMGAIWGGAPVLAAGVWMAADHHGDGINWTDVGVATLAGIAGGVVGAFIGIKVGQGLGRVVGGGGSRSSQYFKHLGVGVLGAVGGGIGGGLAGGAVSVVAQNAIAAAHGESVNLFDGLGRNTLIQGATAGLGGGLLGGASAALRTSRPGRGGMRAMPAEPPGQPPRRSAIRDTDVRVSNDRNRIEADPTPGSGKHAEPSSRDLEAGPPRRDEAPGSRHPVVAPSDNRPVRVQEPAPRSQAPMDRDVPAAARPVDPAPARAAGPVHPEASPRPAEPGSRSADQVPRPGSAAPEAAARQPRAATPEPTAQPEARRPEPVRPRADRSPVESPGRANRSPVEPPERRVSVDAARDQPAPRGPSDTPPTPNRPAAAAEPPPAPHRPEHVPLSERPPGAVEHPPAAAERPSDPITPRSAPGDDWKPAVRPAQPIRHIEHGGEPVRSPDVAPGTRGLRRQSPIGDTRRPGGPHRPGDIAPTGRVESVFNRGRGERGPGLAPEMAAGRPPDHNRPIAAEGGHRPPAQPPAGGPPGRGGAGDDFHGGGRGFDGPGAGGGHGHGADVRFGNASVHVPPGGEVRLGRSNSPLSEHFSAHPSVSRRHATLGTDEHGRVWIRDDGSTYGTYVNGKRIDPGEQVRLNPGDRVRLGVDYESRVDIAHTAPKPAPPPTPISAPAAHPAVVHLSGPDGSLPLRLAPGQEIGVGRSNLGALVSDPKVIGKISRNHATIGMDEHGRLWIRDDGSTNGLSVGDRKVRPGEKVPFDHGDRINFGDSLKTGTRVEPEHHGVEYPVARAVEDFPSVFDQPRTLETLRRRLPPDVSFDDLMAVREQSYRRNGMEPPALSKENLDSFLGEVWNRRNDPDLHIYRMYSGADSGSVPDPRGYIRELVDLMPERADGLPRSALVQSRKGYILLDENNWHSVDPDSVGFVHYERAGRDSIDVQYRVYVNAEHMSAPGLMRGLVNEVLHDADRFPGVSSAKVAGPGRMRTDGIVVYVSDVEAAGRVVDWLKAYQRSNPEAFQWTVPAMTNQEAAGISIGAEPQRNMGRGQSFGSVRASIIEEQLGSARNFDDFKAAVERAFHRNGVDSSQPHRNRY